MKGFIVNFNEAALAIMQGNILLGMFILFGWTFAESSFFPIPPDFVMWGLIHANPNLWMIYATLTTVASITGALFGYFIGQKAGRPILKKFIKGTDEEREAKIDKTELLFKKYGNMAILIAALTPIPYKIFTIVGGLALMPKRGFIFWSIIGRGFRFYLGAYSIHLLTTNKELGKMILKNKELIFGSIALVFIIGFLVNIHFKNKSKSKQNI